jgi:flagellar hook-associated protein 2
MPSIDGLGVNPNSSVYNTVQQYMVAERVQLDRLEDLRDEAQMRRAAFTDLGSKLSALRTAIQDFRWSGTLTPLNSFAATSSDAGLVGASAGASASDGVHTVSVASLAQAHSLVSDQLNGNETFSLVGAHSFEIVQGGESHLVSVTLAEGDTHQEALAKIVTAINASGADVTASLAVTDAASGGYRILLTSQVSGTTGLISEIRDEFGDLAATVGLAGASSSSQYSANTVQEAADAAFTIDGLAFVSSSNRVTEAISGVTLDLVGVSESPVTVTIERDVEEVRGSIQNVLDAYNELLDYVREKTSGADSEGEGRGLLTGDTLFMTLRSQLRTVATSTVPDLLGEGRLARLAEIGITASREGRLTITDADALEGALLEKPDEIERLFADEEEGVAVRIVDLIDRHVNAGGLLASQRQLAQIRQRTLDQRIAREETYLARREAQLADQLASLQNMMYALQQQQQILSALGYI